MRWLLTSFFAVVLSAGIAAAGGWYWQKRIGRSVEVQHKLAYQRVKAVMWPKEPDSPDPVDSDRFRTALEGLCKKMPPERLSQYAGAILGDSARFGVDPFLIAALVYDRSRCLPKTPDAANGFGLTRIDVEMHSPQIRRGEYAYFLMEGGSWAQKKLKIDRYPFNKWKADQIEPNIYFAAAILKIFSLQCRQLDEAFPGVAHRNPISHWFYGERVLEIEPEDRVLTERRRMLEYYFDTAPAAAGSFREVAIVSPLDGVPRLAIDDFGNLRDAKYGPGHQGIDIDGTEGEPVRALASGRVGFAGVDLPGVAASSPMSPKQAAAIPNRRMGAGGLYVCVNHGAFSSCYMHLESLAVVDGDQVEAGQVIGALGRSGTKVSGPHLHLEIRIASNKIDPASLLADVLVDPRTADVPGPKAQER